MSTVAHLRAVAAPEPLLTKKQLAGHLERSNRWIEMRMRDGMPSLEPTARYPHRRFRLSEVEAWLEEGPPAKSTAVTDRLAQLEQTVATLAATVEQLQREG